jgi:murein DD-endopeptidase MepM/ murein hydrolase activator NlpD
MKAAALAIAAFTGFPGAFTPSFTAPPQYDSLFPSYATPAPTLVGWPDSWMLLDPTVALMSRPPQPGRPLLGDPGEPAPETSAVDEESAELVSQAAELAPHVVLVGCELALSGTFTPESWARDLWQGAPPPTLVENGHTDHDGQWVEYDQIPRRPERPEAYLAYRYPLADAPVVSGYDLDKPDAEQRRGRMHAVGHGGVDLVAQMGTPIEMIRLDHQIGNAEVLYVGTLYGETVVTRHSLREAGVLRDYLLIFGHLDRAAEGLRRGQRLRDGATVGFVGNSDSPDLVHLHLEARRVRDRVDAWKLPPDFLHAREYSVVTDPRNVLPLRYAPVRVARCRPRLAPPTRHYWLGDEMALGLE